jgi:hypothetical protein
MQDYGPASRWRINALKKTIVVVVLVVILFLIKDVVIFVLPVDLDMGTTTITEEGTTITATVVSSKHSARSCHKHEQLTLPYPTVGIPDQGQPYNYSIVPPSKLAEFDK